MPFRKYRLLAYEPEPLQALNTDGFMYQLTIEEVTWFGLVQKVKTISMLCPYNVDPDEFWKPKLNLWVYPGRKVQVMQVNQEGKIQVDEDKMKLAILAPGVAGKPEREQPCINCDTGEYVFLGTDPGGLMRYECSDCGHQVTYP